MNYDTDPSRESNPASNKKVDAIYSLRAAAEAKALAEVKANADPTPAACDELLQARMTLESKTQDAVEVCHECGHAHGTRDPHHAGNVLDFRPR